MPGKKKAGTKKAAPKAALSSRAPLADLLDSMVCDCWGETIVGMNGPGRALLGYGGKASPVGTPFHALVEAGKPKTTLAALYKGRQPKRVTLRDRKGRPVPVDATAKLMGGSGPNARVLIIAAAAPQSAKAAAHKAPTNAELDLSGQTAQILGAASNGIVAVDLQGIITLANPAAADLLNRDASAMKGMPIERALVYGSGHPKAGKPIPIKSKLADGPHYVDEEVHLGRSDGESFEAVYVVAPVTQSRRTVGYVITLRDITARRRSEAELRLAAAVFDHSPEGVIVADAKGRITKVNPAYTRIAGCDSKSVMGQNLSEVLFSETKTQSSVLDMLQGSDQTQWEQWCKSIDGRRYAARVSVSVVRDHTGSIQQYVTIVADITRRKVDEEKIIYQANYDQLTGLPNRTLFMDRLTRLVLEGRRAKTSVGLMFIDLDGFKAINDTLGHDAGDELLRSTARRLEKCVREADTVARLGGDEFTVIMPLIDNFEAAGFVAGRIIKSLTEPFDLGGREGRVSASIGISLLPAQASTAGELLHNADVAMYHAKHQGKANYQFFRPELEGAVQVKERAL
ncbi:MAG: diguanylate cyclase [Rhodospirillaceae bacterium]|nr:diguanylate cyclase [Rhodospirillaceae bacterium]